MKIGDQCDEAEENAPGVEEAMAIRDENGAAQDGDGTHKKNKKP